VEKLSRKPRRRKRPSRGRSFFILRAIGIWFKEVSRRIGLVIVHPFRAFSEIAENPDLGGPILVLSLVTALDLVNRYILYTYKTKLYIVKNPGWYQPQPGLPPMNVYTLYTLAMTFLIYMAYMVLKSVLIYYLSAWLLKGERSFTSLLIATVYSFSVYILRKTVEIVFALYILPPVDIYTTVRDDILALSSSATLLLLNEDYKRIALALSEASRKAWENLPVSKVMTYVVYGFDLWIYLIGILIVYYVTELPKDKAVIVGVLPLVLDVFLRMVFTRPS